MFLALQAKSFIFPILVCTASFSYTSARSHSLPRNLVGASQGLNSTNATYGESATEENWLIDEYNG